MKDNQPIGTIRKIELLDILSGLIKARPDYIEACQVIARMTGLRDYLAIEPEQLEPRQPVLVEIPRKLLKGE